MHAINRDPGRLSSGGLARGLARIAERPRVVMAVALVAAVAAAGAASRLRLRTSLVELLPTRDPAVVSLERTRTRTGDMNLLLVGIRSPDRAANLRYAAALTHHLQALPPSVCGLAAYNVRDLADFFQKNRWLYVPEDRLEEVRDGLRKAILKKKNPLIIDLADDAEDADPKGLVARLEADGARAGGLEQRFPGGDFVHGDFAWVAALPPGGMLVENAGEGLLEAVRAFVAANPPAAFHPAMQVMPAGPVMATLRNREAVEHDIVAVTLACIVVIGLSIGLYFRSLRALPLVVAPALLGTLVAFAAAALAFGYLNSSTAFLGSIILGNGINYAIVLLAAFRERRRAGDGPREALARPVEQVWRSTLAASLAAAAAYASLALTGFRGFSQFGVMGAVGSVACWAATFLVLPALLGRFGGPAPATRAVGARAGGLPALVARRPGVLLAGALALTAVSALGLRHFAHDPFEYDFRKLSTSDEGDAQRRQFEGGVQELFGRWHTPNVLVADRPEQVEPMRAAIRAQDDAAHPHVGQIVSVWDVLPGAPDVQGRKLALLRDIRKLASDPGLATLDAETRRRIHDNLPPASLAALGPNDLPPFVRRPFTELDGTVGRILLVYHAEGTASLWDGHELQAFAGVLQHLPLADGSTIDSSGPPMVFGAMVRSILHDGPRASLLALLAVVLLVGLVIRPVGAAALAVGTMLVGVVWMIGGAGVAGVRVTFLNFIALPITFGIGVEYAVNVAARLRVEPDAGAAVRSTGSAVALCSWTTIVGYGSLLAAQSQALRGFGAMAILGEVSCLLAAVVGLPALVSWRRRRAEAPRPAPASDDVTVVVLPVDATPVVSS
jgi:predicted RND superfamily exporter protein